MTRSSLVYTDRSVYRPQQKLLWKVVAYEGGGEDSRFRTSPRTSLTVELLDANNDHRRDPAGRHQRLRLGGRRVHDPVRTAARPVARAQLAARRGRGARRGIQAADVRGDAARSRAGDPAQPPGEPARRRPLLLRPARHDREGGLARDAAGRPALVVVGLWGGGFDTASRVVAAGKPASTRTAASRSASRPRRTREASREVTWTYAVEADVTDEGGETRSATRRLPARLRVRHGTDQRSSRLRSRGPRGLPSHPAHRPRRRSARGRRRLDAGRTAAARQDAAPGGAARGCTRGPRRCRLRVSHARRRHEAAQRPAVRAVRRCSASGRRVPPSAGAP